MRGLIGASAVAIALVVSQAASACEGSVGLLRDSFDGISAIWEATEDMNLEDGQAEVTSRPGKSEKIFAEPKFGDVDICVDVVVTSSPDLAGTYIGIGFWFEDYKNLYTFQITLDGYAGVYRLKDDKWETILKDKASSSIVTGLDSVNTVRVVLEGSEATLYINGDRFGSIEGEAPEGGSHVGLVMEGPSGKAATFRYDDVDVSYPD